MCLRNCCWYCINSFISQIRSPVSTQKKFNPTNCYVIISLQLPIYTTLILFRYFTDNCLSPIPYSTLTVQVALSAASLVISSHLPRICSLDDLVPVLHRVQLPHPPASVFITFIF